MIPKMFLAEDLGSQLALMQAELRIVRKRLDLTQKRVEAQRRRLDALRKHVAWKAYRPADVTASSAPSGRAAR